MTKLLTVRTAADALSVSERHVRDLVNEGRLPVVRIGSAVRFDPEKLAALVAAGGTRDGEGEGAKAAA